MSAYPLACRTQRYRSGGFHGGRRILRCVVSVQRPAAGCLLFFAATLAVACQREIDGGIVLLAQCRLETLNIRSEERRVGKEWRSRWWTYKLQEKRVVDTVNEIIIICVN